MKQRDLMSTSVAGAVLLAVLCFLAFAAVLALSGCHPLPPTPPGPGPVDPPSPEPGPAATSCGRAEQRSRELGCSTASETAAWVDACERYEALGGASRWNPEAMSRATSCEQIESARGGE